MLCSPQLLEEMGFIFQAQLTHQHILGKPLLLPVIHIVEANATATVPSLGPPAFMTAWAKVISSDSDKERQVCIAAVILGMRRVSTSLAARTHQENK